MPNSSCVACKLHESCLTVGVDSVGTGNILFVGGVPGPKEDLDGEAYTGKAGLLLKVMLQRVGLLQHATLTYAVRCRPTGKAKASNTSLLACRANLRAEIESLRPVCIVALGDTALKSLTGRSGIQKYRGQEHALHKSFEYDCPVFATYEPTFIFKSPQVQFTIEADFKRVADRDKPPVVVEWNRERPKVSEVIAWDIETDWDFEKKSGGDNVVQLAFAGDGPVSVSTDPRDASVLFGAATTVTHNGWSFDVPKMASNGVPVPLGDDTQILAYLDDETQAQGLEALTVKYLGVKGWKEGIHEELGSDNFSLYNARDAAYTRLLWTALSKRLGSRKRIHDYIIRPAYQALRECSRRGIWIDDDAVQRARGHFEHKRCKGERGLKHFGDIDNPRSLPEVGRALIAEGHNLPVTKQGQPQTGVGILAALDQTMLVKALRYYRKADKSVNGFVVPYSKVKELDNRVHPEYLLWRTTSGRSNARRPNVQQLARDPMLRAFFSAPPGFEFAQADYASIEFRLGGFIAGAKTIIENYAKDPNWDAHTWFAAILYGKPEKDVTRLERQIAKSANFGLLYMAQWFTLQEYTLKTTGILLSQADAQKIRETWHATFPEFRPWYKKTEDFLMKHGYIESLTGRRRHYGDPLILRGLPESTLQGFIREAVNMQVQSLGADVALLGLANCHQKELPINGFFHDANSFEFPTGGTESMLSTIRTCMVEAPVKQLSELFGVTITVPLVIEVKVGEEKWLL